MEPTASPAFLFVIRRFLRHACSSAVEEPAAMADAAALPVQTHGGAGNIAASKRQNQNGYGTMGY
eukprot:10454325-Lingulodinium_polyedra.AAC.1